MIWAWVQVNWIGAMLMRMIDLKMMLVSVWLISLDVMLVSV